MRSRSRIERDKSHRDYSKARGSERWVRRSKTQLPIRFTSRIEAATSPPSRAPATDENAFGSSPPGTLILQRDRLTGRWAPWFQLPSRSLVRPWLKLAVALSCRSLPNFIERKAGECALLANDEQALPYPIR